MSNVEKGKSALRTAYQGTSHPEDAGNEQTAALERGIADTRKSLAMTFAALETQLNPEQLRVTVDQQLDRVEERVRVVVQDKLEDAKGFVKEEMVEAKNLLRNGMDEAESKFQRGLVEARGHLRE